MRQGNLDRPCAGSRTSTAKSYRAEGGPPGFYRSGELLELWIVVLSELPKTAETRLLRLLGPQQMRQQVQDEIAALPEGDPARRPWLELLDEMVYLVRSQILACQDLALLDRWLVKAATATSVSEVLVAAA